MTTESEPRVVWPEELGPYVSLVRDFTFRLHRLARSSPERIHVGRAAFAEIERILRSAHWDDDEQTPYIPLTLDSVARAGYQNVLLYGYAVCP